MTHRKFRDGDGKTWDVWEVYPSAVEQRISGEHPAGRRIDSSTGGPREIKILVPTALQQGWLAFQSGSERRRLAPIPGNWDALAEDALIALLGRADRLSDGDGRA
jgi:hypothetical protein